MGVKTAIAIAVISVQLAAQPAQVWATIGRDAQHTGRSPVAARDFRHIAWSTPVDAVLAGTPGALLIHYGTPILTAANTVLLPVRSSDANTFQVEARSAADGALKYTLPSDYAPPDHNWIPSYSPGLNARNRLFYPCAGGTVCYRDTPDAPTGDTGRIAFYGDSAYTANQSAMNEAVKISTPIVADHFGAIFFGYVVTSANPAGLPVGGGLARIPVSGAPSFISAAKAAHDPSITQVQMNSAPALSNNHHTVYFAVSSGNYTPGYLVAVSNTLTPISKVRLQEPTSKDDALIADDSTASPVIGPDGDVYFGVVASSPLGNDGRGWMLHFDGTLAHLKTPGAFGWDSNPSIVPRALVPNYSGKSPYLLFTKYNHYAGIGTGDGRNRLALLDPNTPMIDPISGATVMNEVLTILGSTPDGPFPAVKEWCINSAAIDLVNKVAIANSEDGVLYRWDFTTNTFTQKITLTAGVAEAYTPTVIGPDGTVYAINDATLFAVR